jgi:Tfp pilus assembly protein PilN
VITPNLASRPFLNTRPVWVVAGVAGFLALVLIVLNLRLILVTSRTLEDEITNRDELESRYREVAAQVRTDITALEKVPWRSLEARVEATNNILRQQSFSWPQMLDDIERVMPYDLRLTRIAPSVRPDGVLLSFDVVARNRDALLEFLDNLLLDPQFENPTPSSETTPEESETGSYLLSMSVAYLPPGAAP